MTTGSLALWGMKETTISRPRPDHPFFRCLWTCSAGQSASAWMTQRLLPGRIRVLSVRPRRPCVPALVHQQHLRLFATLAESMGSVDCEKHRFPFGLIRPILFAIELDEPNVFLTND